jgi:guanylate kinase
MNIHKSSNLYVISAPSGAGKTSLVRELCKRVAFMRPSISYTTRKIRKSEIDGKDYFFTSREHFESMISKDQFIEYQSVYGNLYGSTRENVLNQLDEGYDVILEIDYKGMMKIKSIYPEAITIYIVPPSIDSLRERLISRAQDDLETVEKRISSARFELCYAKFADYVIINGNFRSAFVDLVKIILVNKLTNL